MAVSRPGDTGKLEVIRPGTAVWIDIPLVTAVDLPEVSAEVADEPSMDGRSQSSTSLPTAGPATSVIQVNEALEYWEILRQAHQAGTTLTFRFTAQSRGADVRVDNAVQGDTIAIAAAGVLTGAGALAGAFGEDLAEVDPWLPGNVVVAAQVAYALEQVLTASTIRVSRYGAVAAQVATADDVALANVAATPNWELVRQAVTKRFAGPVTGLGGGTGAQGAARTVPLTVTMNGFPTEGLIVG